MTPPPLPLPHQVDVVVVGGGPAGLNGALMLARSRRSVLVVDAGTPRNAPADAVHGLLGHDGTPPAQLLERGRDEVQRYGGQVVRDEVVAAAREDGGFRVDLASGAAVRSRRLLLASGAVDELPAVPGLAERWGRDVVHCPYCHGYEVRDRAIAVLGGPMPVHRALLFRQLSDDVVYLPHTAGALPEEDAALLAARGVRVVEGEVRGLEVAGDALTGVRLADGGVVPCQALAVASRVEVRAGFVRDLGLEVVEHPMGVGTHVPTEAAGVTAVPGVWAAGNLTDLTAQVGPSAAAGAMAGAHVNADLVMEEARVALADLTPRAG